MKKFDPSTGSAALTLGVVLLAGLLLSLGTIFPPGRGNADSGGSSSSLTGDDEAALVDGEGGDDGSTGGVAGTSGGKSGSRSSTAGGARASGGAGGGGTSGEGGGGPTGGVASENCNAARNGGATDVGVSADRIKLAATIVNDGPGASFLAPVRIGMKAVVNKVNGTGGICGRRLDLILRNDSWNAKLGKQFIENFVESEKVFALAVVPSSEGLEAADSYIARQQVPVVGSDGMLIHQYRNPWIWPVATSTISTMHIMAKEASDRGAKHFGIVFDAQYHFGVEGAYAFNQAVKRLTGNNVDGYDPSLKECNERFCGIQPNKSSYTGEARGFNEACGIATVNQAPNSCDFIAILLEPDTALSWFAAGRDSEPRYGFGGAQPLFTSDFAKKCRGACDRMWVWTGYNPPIEQYAGAGAVAKYVEDVRRESASADVNNQFLEGGYIGMRLMAEALTKVGPNLTRANLRTVLDNMTFDSGLTAPLTWREGNHFANATAQAFEIQYKQSFTGWRSKTSPLADPWVGQDTTPGQ